MELSQEQELKLKELIEPIKDSIVSIELGGSCTVPWIENVKDFDIIIYLKDHKSYTEAMHTLKPSVLSPVHKDYNLDIKIVTEETHAYHIDKVFSIYESHLSKPLFEYPKLTDYNFIESPDFDQIKKIFIQKIKSFISRFDTNYLSKGYYQAFITLCLFKNKKGNLTKTQISKLNKIRNKPIYAKEAIEDVIKEVE